MSAGGLCLDATGTLFELRESVGTTYARAALAVGVRLPAWRLDDAFARVLRHGPSLAAAALAATTRAEREASERAWWRDRVRQTFQATDSTVRFADPDALFDSLFQTYRRPEAWQIRPGMLALLEALHAAGLPMAVVSQFDHRLPEILEGLGLRRFFELVEIPSQRGRAKPDEAVFAAVADAFGCALGDLAYLGDDAPEVLAAIAGLGITVFDVRAETDPARLIGGLLAADAASAAKLGAAHASRTSSPVRSAASKVGKT